MAEPFDIAKRVYDQLATTAVVSDLVSTRIYADELPINPTFPCILFTRVSEIPIHAFIRDTGNEETRFRVSYWDTGKYKAIAGRNAVKLALSRYRTTTGCPTVDGTLTQNSFDFVDDDRKEQPIYQAVADFLFYHEKCIVYYPVVTSTNVTGASLSDTGWRFSTATGGAINGVTSAAEGWVFVVRDISDTLSRLEFIDV